MPKINKLIIAAAGAGKTTYLINEALKQQDKEVLITTYTEANESEIKKKFIEINGSIPKNVTIQTWFSMLLRHGVKPYQDYLTDKKINGMILVNQQSSQYVPERDVDKYYFSAQYKIYSDKLSKFVFKCNEKSNGAIFDRLSRIYNCIFIDEVQDLAGYDLELINLLLQTDSNIVLVGDPRQTTYNTHWEQKYRQYQDGKIKEFIQNECQRSTVEIDEISLNCSYRNNECICEFSSKLFPCYPISVSNQNDDVEHKGIFFIKESDVDAYLEKYQPLQLRTDRRKQVNINYTVMNFGESKGLGFDRVLIYPTQPILDFILKNKNFDGISRAKFYVAVTRARYSVGIVYDFEDNANYDNVQKWKIQES